MKIMHTNFEFKEEDLERIKSPCIKLRDEEDRLGDFVIDTLVSVNSLNKQIELGKENFEFVLSVFSNNADFNKRNNVKEGEPICIGHFTMIADEEGIVNGAIDKLALNPSHPLSHLGFCFSMQLLVFHYKLSWEDILLIDNVSIDVKVNFKIMLENKYIKKRAPIYKQKKVKNSV